MNIQILPSELSDQIAAGEVVERPSSVVKELIENSIDAGAKNIFVEIKNGGKDLIFVRDDGIGMNREDAIKCTMRHATSKIATINELFSLQSFGFRGEALAAISSVSNFNLLTKTKNENNGVCIKISGGKNKEILPSPSNTGTSVKIENLFFPTPARLKNLKNSATEFSHIFREIIGFSLAYPEIVFTVQKDDKLYKKFSQNSLKDRVLQIFNKKEIEMTEVNFQNLGIKINGFVSQAGFCQRSKKEQFLFVNNRRIEDYRIAYAIREAFVQSAGIEKHLHPFFAIFIKIDPILVDSNVHPRKLEVKFSEPHDVFITVKNAVVNSLESTLGMNHNFSPKLEHNLNTKNSVSNFSGRGDLKVSKNNLQSSQKFNQSFGQNNFQSRNFSRNIPNNFSPENFENEESFDNLKLIGQVAKKYIIAESDNGIVFFDQHALHERQRFEIFWNDFLEQKKSGKFISQNLLVPEILHLGMAEIDTVFQPQNLLYLKKFGFELELIDDENLKLLAVPKFLYEEKMSDVFGEFSEYFANGKIGENSLETFVRKKLEYKSCRGAVMFGDNLEWAEMEKLLTDFQTTKWRNLCPHGRPNHWFVHFDDLDKKFHR